MSWVTEELALSPNSLWYRLHLKEARKFFRSHVWLQQWAREERPEKVWLPWGPYLLSDLEERS